MSDPAPAEERETSAAVRATWREWLGLAVLALPMLVLSTDLTVLFLAMPSIAADLRPGPSQSLWIVHVYGFLIAGFLITMGRLGDRLGRRRLLLLGAGAFGALSVAAALSPTPEMLIAARALLGVAGATLMPSAFSLLRAMFHDPGQLRFSIAVVFSAFSAGGALGPLLAGVLLQHFWWGSVFLVNVPALVLLLAVGPLLLPEYREAVRHRLDLPSVDLRSVALSLGGMLGLIYGLQELTAGWEGAEGRTLWIDLGVLLLGAILAVLFVRRQVRLDDPLLDLRLFTEPRFTTSLGAVLFTTLAMVAGFYLFTQYLQWVLGLTPLQAGLWTVPYIVVNIAGTMLAPALARRLRHVTIIGSGLLVVVVGLAAIAGFGGTGMGLVLPALTLAGFGQGVSMALASDLIISTAPAERVGSAAAMQEVGGEVGTALGAAVGGILGFVAYRAALADTLPAGLPEGVADTAREGISSALAAADGLAAPDGPRLAEAAREAFTHALQTAAGVGAVTIAAVALAVVLLLRRAAVGHEGSPGEELRGGEHAHQPE